MTLPNWWMNSSLDSPSADTNLWQSIKTRLDAAKSKPARAQDIIARELHDRSGTYYVLKNPHVHSYLRLSPREYWVWGQLDGARTIKELIVAYFQAYGSFAFGLVVGLIQQLYEKQMLRDQPQFLFASLSRNLKQRTLIHKLFNPERGLLTRRFLIARFDGLITRLYRAGAWIFFTRFAQVLYLAVAAIGIYLFIRILGDPQFRFTERNLGATIVLLWVAATLSSTLHEMGHALATKHYGREVYRGGLMLYYGLPAAFVDTTDIWLESKRPRVAVALAGPLTSILIASLCSILLWFSPSAIYSPILFQIASIAFFITFLNLNPTLRLDGYYILSDLLEITSLRERSFAFFRHTLIQKILKRERLTRDEIIFVFFGLLTVAWIGYSIFLAIFVYRVRVNQAVQDIFGTPPREFRWLAIAFLILIALSLIFFLRRQIYQLGKTGIAIVRRVELFSQPNIVALLMVALAMILAFVPYVLVPEVVDWLDSVLGAIAITFALIFAVRTAREMRGTIMARAWQLIVMSLGVIAIAHILWGITWERSDAIATVLDLIALALAGLAAVLSAPVLFGLKGSWRAVTTILFGLSWLSLLATLTYNDILPGVVLHLFSVLMLLCSLLHWQLAQSSPAIRVHAPGVALTTNEQLWNGFRSLAESVLEELRVTFGSGNASRAQSLFNSISFARDWGMDLVGGKLKILRSEDMTVADLADLLAAALSSLLRRIAQMVGESPTRAALAHAYDVLSWDQREVIADYILNQVEYAEGLAEQFTSTRQDVVSLLQRVPLFANFTIDELRSIGEHLNREHYRRGETIIRQGDMGARFYIVRRGSVQVSRRNADGLKLPLAELESGDYFGQAAMLTGEPHDATVRARTPVSVFTLDKKSFDLLVRAGFRGRDKLDVAIKRVGLLRRIPIFADFDSLELQQIAAKLESVYVEGGQTIVEQGDLGDKFYIIESGEVDVTTHHHNGEAVQQARLGSGEYFGEIALLMNVPRTATVVAVKPTELLALGADPFNELVSQSQSISRALERASSRRMLLISQSMSRTLPS